MYFVDQFMFLVRYDILQDVVWSIVLVNFQLNVGRIKNPSGIPFKLIHSTLSP